MRISSFQIHQQGVQDMQRINRQVAETQQQIASGTRISRPSDDPVGAAKIVELRREIAQRETYIRNAEEVETRLSREEAVLSQMVDVIHRVQELFLQASNGALSGEDRQFLAAEIEARGDELEELMNARDVDGQYLFSGNLGGTQPFVRNGLNVTYQGDEGQRQLQVDSHLFVPFSDSGRALFVDVPSVAPAFTVESHPQNDESSGQIHKLGIVDNDALEAFAPEDVVIEFQSLAAGGGQSNFTARRLSDDRVVENLENIPFTVGAAVTVAGMQFSIDGAPQEGDRFILRTTNSQSVLETVAQAARDLRNIDDATQPEAFEAAVERGIGNLDSVLNNLSSARSDVGARLNTVSSMRDFHSEQNLNSETLLSEVRDLDYAEAVSALSFQSFVLEAAQQSFVRVSRLSLFNAL